MNRRIGIAAALTAALAAPLLASAPASAGAGVGCTSGNCSISLSTIIKVSGGDATKSDQHYSAENIQPPCEWNPIGDQVSGSKAIIQEWQPDPPTAYGVDKSYRQAKQLLKNPQQGTWYILPVNPKASAAGKAKCLTLPLYWFAPTGTTPPVPPIPPRQVAKYAYNHMTIPTPTIMVSPNGKGYVNLGTYVWGNWQKSLSTGQLDEFSVSAQVPGQTPVWVLAKVARFRVNPTSHGKVYNDCGHTGSHFPQGQPPASAGAGQAPDCGVLWQGPDSGATVSVTVTWRVTYGLGTTFDPNGGKFLAIYRPNGTVNVPVSEIQSINGG